MTDKSFGILLAVTAGILWSTIGLSIKSIEQANAFEILFFRSIFISIFIGFMLHFFFMFNFFKNFLNDYFTIKHSTSLQNLISNFEKYSLFLKLISVSLICDLDIEKILQDLRSSILSSIFNLKSTSNLLNFKSALAIHCFTN